MRHTADGATAPRIRPLRWPGLAAPAAAAGLLALGGATWRLALRFERAPALEFHEPWRLLTAHLVHLNPSHLLLDGLGLALVWLLFAGTLPALVWWLALIFGAVAIDAGLLLLHPEIAWYVGLSGVLHGQFAAGALWSLVLGRREAIVMLALLCLKLAFETVAGPVPLTAAASRGPVVEEAHRYGALGGGVAFAFALALHPGMRRSLRR
jgi:rhomboid family GlyGly-CTERM serine protease